MTTNTESTIHHNEPVSPEQASLIRYSDHCLKIFGFAVAAYAVRARDPIWAFVLTVTGLLLLLGLQRFVEWSAQLQAESDGDQTIEAKRRRLTHTVNCFGVAIPAAAIGVGAPPLGEDVQTVLLLGAFAAAAFGLAHISLFRSM